MKTIVKIVASLCIGLFAVACQQFYVDTQMTPEKAAASIKLECDALDSYTIQGEKPQSVSFKVASTTPWSITGWENAEWLKVSPVSSALSSLSEDIVISAVANPNYEDRSVTLTLGGENTDVTYRVVITQSRRGKLFVQPVSDVFEAEGNSLPFTIETNLAWEVRSADQWLSFNEAAGVGDGSVKTVQAIAAQNNSVNRSTTVTVTAGDEKYSFTVNQKGQSLEFLPVENPEVDRRGGELILPVKATMDWKVECDNDDFTVEKVARDQLKVSAPFNNKFVGRSAVITIKPVTDDFGDVSSQVEVSQGVNFTLEGDCTVLEDGSVKVNGGAKSHIVFKDGLRYAKVSLAMGECNFVEKGEMWFVNNVGSSETDGFAAQLYNWLTVGKTRVRAEGSIAGGHGLRIDKDSYYSKDYSISLDELNAMKTYEMDIYPDAEEPAHLHMDFIYNGTLKCEGKCMNPFYGNNVVGDAYVGVYTGGGSGTWYVVKTCDVTVYAE